jgi:N-acetyl-anhydromuramyl-L-alanine amidase AmpD
MVAIARSAVVNAPTFRHSFAGLRSTYPRREPIRGIVLHWTGGTRGPAGVYETLRARKGPRSPDGLSVHYVIGADGEVVQMAPHSLVCLHAAGVNEWTVGIEMVNPAYPKTRVAAKDKAQRAVYVDRVRSRRVAMLDFTQAQTDAALLHAEWLCDVLKLPRRVPTDADGSLLRRQMTEGELAGFRGVMGHYHCHPTKNDPGTRLLDLLRQRWMR